MGPRFESRQTLCCDTAGQEDYTVALTTHGDNRRPAAWSRVVLLVTEGDSGQL